MGKGLVKYKHVFTVGGRLNSALTMESCVVSQNFKS